MCSIIKSHCSTRSTWSIRCSQRSWIPSMVARICSAITSGGDTFSDLAALLKRSCTSSSVIKQKMNKVPTENFFCSHSILRTNPPRQWRYFQCLSVDSRGISVCGTLISSILSIVFSPVSFSVMSASTACLAMLSLSGRMNGGDGRQRKPCDVSIVPSDQ